MASLGKLMTNPDYFFFLFAAVKRGDGAPETTEFGRT